MTHPRSITRFVLLSKARSGTSVTIDRLRSHEDVYGHFEVFVRREGHGGVDTQYADKFGTEGRLTDPVAFAYRLLDYTPGPKCVGFKMWYQQAPAAADALMADTDIHKIILDRANRLATYASTVLANQFGKTHAAAKSKDGAKSQQPRIAFEKDMFLRHMRNRDDSFKTYRENCAGPTIDLTYREATGERFGDILDFLGLDPLETSSDYVRINPPVILDRFRPDDHDAITQVLEEIGHPEWAGEET